MKPILKRGMRVALQSRLYENKYRGARSVPAGTIEVVTDLSGGYYQGALLHMVATVEVTTDVGQFYVRVNERALVPQA